MSLNDPGRFEPSETASGAHRAGRLVAPCAAIASVLTVLHGLGIAFSIGAATAWMAFAFLSGFRSGHEWLTCSYCTQPPRVVATREARAKLARWVHSYLAKACAKYPLGLVIVHAVLPKPYLDPWWAKAAAAGVYLLIALVVSSSMLSLKQHLQVREECHVEWCRAGARRNPAPSVSRRVGAWAGHHGAWLLGVLAPALCALGLGTAHHHSTPVAICYGVGLVLVGWVVMNVVLTHIGEPCVRCVGGLPTNGGETAERRMGRLRLFHMIRYWLLGGAFCAWVVSWILAGSVPAKVLVFGATVSIVCWAVLERIHSPLRPWCPWCREHGGEEVEDTVPDPTCNAPIPA